MTSPRRSLATAFVLLLIAAGCSGSDPGSEPDPPESTTSTTGAAATDKTPVGEPEAPPDPEPDPTALPTDPDTRVGTLDNGLTYYVRTNNSPGSSLELRLVVDAGSLQEIEGKGTAHFLEHMLFNGTGAFPSNALDSVLRSFGAEIGPDLNAYTSRDETVYLLSLSTHSDEAVETGFDVLHQWATAATITPEAVEAERGIVRQEYRERVETGNGAVFQHFDHAYLEDTAYVERSPIGTIDGIETVSAVELRDFYERWYRPDNMAVVAVGDLPVDRLEQEIHDRFSSIPAPDTTTEPQIGTVVRRGEPEVSVVTHPDEAGSLVSIDFPVPSWDPGTVGGERLLTMEDLIAAMMTSRFERAQAAGDLSQSSEPFFGYFSYSRVHRYLGTSLQAGDLTTATRDWFSLLEGLRLDGFTADELSQAVSQFRSELDIVRETVNTTQDTFYAATFVDHFLRSAEIGPTEATLDRLDAVVESITLDDVDDHLRWLLAHDQPVVIAVGPSAAQIPTTDELSLAITEVVATSGVDAVELIDSLMDPPEPAETVDEGFDSALDAHHWVFPNGARVSFVETEIVDGFVDLLAAGGGGVGQIEARDADHAGLGRVAFVAVDESGVGDHSALALDRFLSSTSVSFASYISQTDEGFSGSSSADDLEILFQLLHLRMTEPRVEPVALSEALLEGQNLVSAMERDPGLRTFAALLDARYGDTPGFSLYPSSEALAELDADTALAIYQDRLGGVDDFVVALAGDVDPEMVEYMARRYVGTLPTVVPESWIVDDIPFPEGLTRRDVVLTADTSATGMLIYSESFRQVDAGDEATAAVLTSIVNKRLFEGIREELGASYGGSGAVGVTRRPAERIELLISADADPERLAEVQDAILTELRDLAANGPSGQEMAEAHAVVTDDYAFHTNGDHLFLLVEAGLLPGEDLLSVGRRFRELDRVSGSRVQAMADELIGPGDVIVITRTVG
ncbi:MAG: insulinase family protein [Actinomycetia bacterium]|nr:insulinase family protein [Actinomycetes bacterium]